jgi:Tfp pilus assembly protein PilF
MNRIEKLLEFLQQSPGDSFLMHALALEYIKTGEEASARELFEALLEKNPDYVGSYYHLAKLLERTGAREQALQVYERGMQAAGKAGDRHALNELRSAYDDLMD